MAKGLTRNTSVKSIEVESEVGEVLQEVLAAALPLNSTLQELSFEAFPNWPDDDSDAQYLDLSVLFSALGKNTGLKTLKVDGFGAMDESLCTAMQDGLGMNETLECLELSHVSVEGNADWWCRTLSFLIGGRGGTWL
jgi:hypothetical protein